MQIVSLTCYTLKFWGATSKRDNLLAASAKLASTRAALRLFDDAAVLKAFLKYGLGKEVGWVFFIERKRRVKTLNQIKIMYISISQPELN